MSMIPLDLLRKYAIRPEYVIHVGAHTGEEAMDYRRIGARGVLWLEADPALIDELERNVTRHPGQHAVQVLLGAADQDDVEFNRADEANGANHGQSSSVLPLGTHRSKHPEVHYVERVTLPMRRLDDVIAEHAPEFLMSDRLLVNIDVQGYESEVWKGAPAVLAAAQAIVSEANCDELYAGGMLFEEYDRMLVAAGFECMVVELCGCRRRNCSDGGNRWTGWGDGWWRRTTTPRLWSATHPDDANDWYHNIEHAEP